jgi:predicted transcriptional regulator
MVRLDVGTFQALTQIAAAEERPVSWVIRRAVRREVERIAVGQREVNPRLKGMKK